MREWNHTWLWWGWSFPHSLLRASQMIVSYFFTWINPRSKYQISLAITLGSLLAQLCACHLRSTKKIQQRLEHHLCQTWCSYKLLQKMVGFGSSFQTPLYTICGWFPGPILKGQTSILTKHTSRSLLSWTHCSYMLGLFEPTTQSSQHFKCSNTPVPLFFRTLCDYEEISNDSSFTELQRTFVTKHHMGQDKKGPRKQKKDV